MLAIDNRKIFEYSLTKGIQNIADMAAKVYGGNYSLIYRRDNGKGAAAGTFVETLVNGVYEDTAAEDARCVLAELEWPEDGSKTAILLAAAFLESLYDLNSDESLAVSSLEEAVSFAEEKVECMSREGNGALPGGGLWQLTLIRPLVLFSEESHCLSAQLLSRAAVAPLKAIAKNSGKAFYEIYERIRAVSPNQFYSLHQIGLKNSHIPIHKDHMDTIQFGFNMTTGKLANLIDDGVIEEKETAVHILEQTKEIILALGNTRRVWM